MLTLLTFGTLWFWLVSVIAFLVIVALVENEKEVCAGLTILAAFTAFYFLGNPEILHPNPVTLRWCALGYLGGACIWAIIKWTLFVHAENDKYEEAKAQFLRDKKVKNLTTLLKEEWTEIAKSGEYGKSYPKLRFSRHAPEARDYKSRIVAWMTYWPWSAFWTILNDPVRKAMRFFYNRITGLLNKISEHAYRNVGDDIMVDEE